jgi:hypothetical protein
MNEVDLIVLTGKGLFLVEITSRPGEVNGDQQRWRWKDCASEFDIDNPRKLANLKAKRLADLLAHQRVVGAARLPFIEPLIFCSAPGIKLKLPLDLRVFGREPGDGGASAQRGIVSPSPTAASARRRTPPWRRRWPESFRRRWSRRDCARQ